MVRNWKFYLGKDERFAACPNCRSSRVRRCRRKRFFEKTVFRALFLYPYRGESCDERYVRLGLIQEIAVPPQTRPADSPRTL
jgi:hypothetical protein